MIPKSVTTDLLRSMRTNRGHSLYDRSMDHPVLLVYLPYFGCSFCRETMDDLSGIREDFKAKGVELICIHMEETIRGERFFEKYDLKDIEHISDPAQEFYESFGLVKGSFRLLFGLQNMIRGFDAALLQGQGVSNPKPLGDGFQTHGVFMIHGGEVRSRFIHRMASDRPDYMDLVDCGMPPDGSEF